MKKLTKCDRGRALCIYGSIDAALKRRSTRECYYDVRELCEPAIRIGEIV